MRLLIFLLSASACFGQLTMQQMQPFFTGAGASPPFTPRSIPNLTYWWVHTNTVVGNTIQIWPDLIAGNNAFNTSLANSPTNAVIGMRFQAGHYLHVTNWNTLSTNGAFFIICRFENNATQRTFFTGRDNINGAQNYSGVNGSQHWINGSGDYTANALATATSQLLVYAAQSGGVNYTNGVSTTFGLPGGFSSGKIPYAVTNMGDDSVFSGGGGLYIMELGWYPATTLTATDVYNLSNYWKTFYP